VETFPEQFDAAKSRIEIGVAKRARAIAAHTEIRVWLETDAQLVSWGVDTILIGSYARRTAIHPGRDVDVLVKLPSLDVNADPEEVFGAVSDMLVAKYGDRAEPQRRSVKVSFDTGNDEFAVDVVPAVPTTEHWAIPQRDSELWRTDEPGTRWIETDPERLGELTTDMNGQLKIAGQGAYVPTVKLMRQTRRHHLAEAKPGGLYFELLTFWAFDGGIEGGSHAEILAAALASASAQLADGSALLDPALDSVFNPAPADHERIAAAQLYAQLSEKAERALDLPRCRAAVLWREILGENERGPCFPLPDGCDEEGREISPIAAIVSAGSNELSGFATSRDA
jgi:hypothetical protein